MSGQYAYHLMWNPFAGTPQGEWQDAPPALPDALREQLGLRLKRTKGPVEALVVDHVERPTPN